MTEFNNAIYSDSKYKPPCVRNGKDCEKRCVGCRETCKRWKVYQDCKRREEARKIKYRQLKALAEIEERKDRNRERRERAKLREQVSGGV